MLTNKATNWSLRCPKCGRPMASTVCGHCGSTPPLWQAHLCAVAAKQCGEDTDDQRYDRGSAEPGLPHALPARDIGGASTPQWLFDQCDEMALALCGERISLDVAAAEWNHKCQRYYTEDQDGRMQPWDAKAVWLNCPFIAPIIESFVRKAISERDERGTTTFALLPDWGGYQYWDLCEKHGRIHRIKGPVVFRRHDGSTFVMNCGFRRTALKVVVIGPDVQPGFGEPISAKGNAAEQIAADGRTNDDLQNTETPPSLCRWIYERLADAGVDPAVILDPCAGRGNLTRPFLRAAKVIEYEIQSGTNFFAESQRITCDLVLCNPPWSSAEKWLRHIVRVVGSSTPIVFIAPLLFFSGYKDAPVRKYLHTGEAPKLWQVTPLPSDTFVKVYSPGVILWFNLPTVRDVGLVPNRYLVRRNG